MLISFARRGQNFLFVLGLFALGGLVEAGCAEEDPDLGMDLSLPALRPHNFEQINALVLQPTCANSKSCHTDIGAPNRNGAAKVNFCGEPKLDSELQQLCKPTANLG